MGTRADFYMGRGSAAEWLGSIAWDGQPTGIPESILHASDEAVFRREVIAFVSGRKDGTLPSMGWPWPWKDSTGTDHAYAFDGQTWVSMSNHGWLPATRRSFSDEDWETLPLLGFPDMSAIRKVTMGSRSGLAAVIRVKESPRE